MSACAPPKATSTGPGRATILGPMDVVLVRHAESIWNAESRWQGQTDVPLSDRGRGEAAALGARLGTLTFDRRIVSDLARTGATAAAIGGTFERDPAWREIDLGRWGGLLHTEVQEQFPDELRAMIEGRDVALGGGESVPGFEARANRALGALIAAGREDERALVVTHGGVIRAIVMHLLGVRGRRVLIGAGNTSITHLRVTEGRIALVSYNCDAHLGREPDATDLVLAAGDAIAGVNERLGLSGTAGSLCTPRPRATTRIALGAKGSMLRSYAAPALVE